VRLLKPDGLVEKVNILGPFWTSHQYDSLLQYLHSFGYVDNKMLFVFAYDWRVSNFETAARLKAFVDGNPALRDGKFDLLSHSRGGGIVSKIWMLEYGGASKVRKAIYMGTPFQGSMNVFGTLSDGWGDFINRRVALSFPALY
jgi:pimeloyl-ACP methyl ester carboxylesterase